MLHIKAPDTRLLMLVIVATLLSAIYLVHSITKLVHVQSERFLLIFTPILLVVCSAYGYNYVYTTYRKK